MSLRIDFTAVARSEFQTSVRWYENERSGHGDRFFRAVEVFLYHIAEKPERWPEAEQNIREAAMRKWPFCIYYETHTDHILVIAVYHNSRDPRGWQDRRSS